MNAADVRNAEQARIFLQQQESEKGQIINNLPNDLRRYATQNGITQQLSSSTQHTQVYFLSIESVEQNQATCILRWFPAVQQHQEKHATA